MSAAEKHNRLTKEVVTLIGNGTRTLPELMVVVESVIYATMLLLVRLYGRKPKDAAVYLEVALHRATERFAEKR